MGFLRTDRPTLTAMLKSNNTKDLIEEINHILEQGTDTFGFQIDMLTPSEQKEENYRKIFNAMQGKPVYVTNYTRLNPVSHTDDELTNELILATKCGANLIDIRCDLFDRNPYEYSTNPDAIKLQKEVIAKIHSMGAEVLMSSHVLKYIPCEKVLEIAYAQESRGVDIVKIVTNSDSEAEYLENMKTTIRLREQVKTSTLFLTNGDYCKKHRILAPAFGTGMFLVVENSCDFENQPTIKRAKEILKTTGYVDLP